MTTGESLNIVSSTSNWLNDSREEESTKLLNWEEPIALGDIGGNLYAGLTKVINWISALLDDLGTKFGLDLGFKFHDNCGFGLIVQTLSLSFAKISRCDIIKLQTRLDFLCQEWIRIQTKHS